MSLILRDFRAEGYRTLRTIAYPVSDLDVFVGGNGTGKTNLYRALELVRSAAAGTLARDLIAEGGLRSAHWAGPQRRSEPVRIVLGVGFSDPDRPSGLFRYAIEIGYPPPVSASFAAEPHVKRETLSYGTAARQSRLLARDRRSVMVRGEDGRAGALELDLLDSETVLGRLEDPSRYPEIDAVRRHVLEWRFYHGLRTDPGSPLRHPCPAVATASLASDGSDLAAVFATLVHIRADTAELSAIVDRAFPGAELVVPVPEETASFGMRFPEFPHRVFEAHELSDGTLRFLALAGALLAYRLPPFIALNEPESSLHPALMEPLAELIVQAADRSQIWLVTHSSRLAEAIAASGRGKVRQVFREKGATRIEGLRGWGAFEDEHEPDDD